MGNFCDLVLSLCISEPSTGNLKNQIRWINRCPNGASPTLTMNVALDKLGFLINKGDILLLSLKKKKAFIYLSSQNKLRTNFISFSNVKWKYECVIWKLYSKLLFTDNSCFNKLRIFSLKEVI